MDKPIYQMSYEQIVRRAVELRAYELFEWRRENNEPGCALGDWLEAEKDILEQISEMP
jgi:hypothetical protein